MLDCLCWRSKGHKEQRAQPPSITPDARSRAVSDTMRPSIAPLPILSPDSYVNPKQPPAIQNMTQMFIDRRWVPWDEFKPKFQEATDCTEEQLDMITLVFRGGQINWDRWFHIQDWFCPIKRNGDTESDGYDVEMILDIVHKSWFHGFLDVSHASALLAKTPVGTFMIRFSSSTRDNYSLSVKTAPDMVDHWRIQCKKAPNEAPKFYFATTDSTFDNLDDFVSHFGPDGQGNLLSSLTIDSHYVNRSSIRSLLCFPLAVEPAVYNSY
ncbi:SH2 domain-containing protein [Planoprotostelium fungivorum]|uniref:SH2 domain-containing protein n=1 Tax=Planoprotostelium fungivorum TaxID=1890364 RepID=A0A2P6NNZ2_9EUKA|nr:SH2 domain-containing protein [Planoprotostelium fungivorum]